jgi:hypothetical protein
MPELQDDIRAAVAELSAAESAPAASPAPAPAESSPAPAPSGRTRDDSGRFAPREAARDGLEGQAPAPAPGPAPAPTAPSEGQEGAVEGQSAAAPAPGPAPAAQDLRAPVSWKPEERELWSKVDPEVRKIIQRREQEIQNGLSQAADSRRFTEAFSRVVQPYANILQNENAHPLQAVQELFKSAAILRSNDAQTKAQMVAQMIQRFRVDITMLDDALASATSGQRSAPDTSYIDQKLQPVVSFVNDIQAQRQAVAQREQQAAMATLNEFMSDPKNEFALDVANDMADLMDLAAQRGAQMSLQDAYTRATMAHPTISKIISGRSQSASAAQQTAAARRAKEAAASVTGDGAPPQGQEQEDVDSVRGAIRASIRQLSNR